jgi:dTMP kinase
VNVNVDRARSSSGVPRGFFLTFEGIEGSGKSTHARRLNQQLQDAGYRVYLTREPGGTALGEALRAVLLDPGPEPLVPEAELFIILASRAQHVRRRILVRLEKGEVVISDRYSEASLAYQGGGRGLGLEAVRPADRLATGGLMPDLTILCDLPVEEALARVGARARQGGEVNRFDRETLDFHESVRRTYLHLASQEPERIVVVDTRGSEDEVATRIMDAVEPRLGERRAEGAVINSL